MALPAGVTIGRKGRWTFVTQRGYYSPPYTSCMFASLAMVLEWAGYRLPLPMTEGETPPANFVWTMHNASGAPTNSGTTTADSRKALQRLLPDAPVLFGTLADADFGQALGRDRATVRVIARMHDLPRYLRRWCGYDWRGRHALAVTGRRLCNGADGGRHADHVGEVEHWLMDPMGRPSRNYNGEWVPAKVLLPTLDRGQGGGIVVALAYRSAAVPKKGSADPGATPTPPVG